MGGRLCPVAGRPEVALGYKGALGVRLDVQTLATDAHSSLEPVAPGPAWRLVQLLASIRERDGTVRIRGFYDNVLSATDEERRAIAAASSSEEGELREMLGLDEFADGLSSAALWERVSFQPTSNLAGIDSGYSGPGIKTVLPASASAWMDFRLVPAQRPDEILELLRAHLDREGFADVEVTPIVRARPAKTPLAHPFVRRIVDVAEAVSGETASVIPFAPPTLRSSRLSIRVEDIEPALRFTHALLRDLGSST